MNKPYLFYYWEGPMPSWIGLCHQTIEKNARNGFNIIKIQNDEQARKWVDLPPEYSKIKAIHHKTDYLKAALIYKYGGFWVDSDTIILKDFSEWANYFETHDFIGIPGFFGGPKGSATIKRWLDEMTPIIKNKQVFTWAELINPIITHPSWKEFEPLTRDMISPVYYLGEAHYYLLNKSMYDYIKPETKVCILFNSLFPEWFKRMNSKDILKGKMLISQIFNTALKV